MKRINMILVAFALVLTMTQCKKNEETNQNETVTITLDAKRSSGSRVNVNTATGTVDFESGDKVYVGSGGKYVGLLTHNGTNFVGNITNPTEGQPLQFYFLGNVMPTETLTAGTTEECSVIISDQTEHLPVISCAASYENYVSGVTAYSAHLLNKCALVKFNVTTPSNSPICITGMKNKVMVDFTQNTMTPSMDGEGVIMLPAGSGENVEKWAILLPQETLEEGEDGSAISFDGKYSGTRPAITAITENGYFAIGFNIIADLRIVPEGAVNGVFKISADGKRVFFSKGNLQYIGSATVPYWKFADNQWDYLGDNGQGSTNQYADRDLFGWGTSGFNHGGVCWQPWSTSQNFSDYFISGSRTVPLIGSSDWGYNAINNGGNAMGVWYTLSWQQWDYLLDERITNSGIRYTLSNVNGVKGLLVLPDEWNSQLYSLQNPNVFIGSFNDNTISLENWNNIFEPNGAVFLPCSGQRTGTEVSYVGTEGCYWSATPIPNLYEGRCAYYVEFNDGLKFGGFASRYLGASVRLVQDY
jgi:hypothetical protein